MNENVEPPVTLLDLGDELLEPVESCEVSRVGRGGRAETRDGRLQLAVWKIDARHRGAGAEERLGAREPDPPLGAGDERHAPVEPPGDRGGSTHRRATIASISTGMSKGRWGTPTEVRAPRLSVP